MLRHLLRPLVGILALLASAPVVVLLAGPAHACSCAFIETSERAELSEMVFTGTVDQDSVTKVDPYGTKPIEFTVTVTGDFKGGLPARVTMQTASNSAACGLGQLPGEGEEWLWFANPGVEGRPGSDGAVALNTGLCSGSGPADTDEVATVTSVLGAPEAPAPATDPPATEPGDDPVTESQPEAADEHPSRMPLALGGIAVVALIAAGGWRLRHRRS